MAQRMADLAQNEADFRSIRLLWGFPQIRMEGVQQGGFVLRDRIQQSPESLATELRGPRRAGLEKIPLAFDEGREIHILGCGMDAMG
jgi:hypothetical protein